MATCQICKYAGNPKDKPPCADCKGYSKYEYKKPQTNADSIRAMSDEELAKLLLDADQGNFTVDLCDERFCDLGNCSHDCTAAALKWLKQPAEE